MKPLLFLSLAMLILLSCTNNTAEQAQTDSPPQNAWAEAASRDARTPVPQPPTMALHMRKDMRDHLAVVQEVTSALAADDFAAAALATERIANVPGRSQQCEHMGAGAEGFTPLALGLHAAGDKLLAATRAEDRAASLGALSTLLQSCTGCHATYRQEVVSVAEYEQRSGVDMGDMHSN